MSFSRTPFTMKNTKPYMRNPSIPTVKPNQTPVPHVPFAPLQNVRWVESPVARNQSYNFDHYENDTANMYEPERVNRRHTTHFPNSSVFFDHQPGRYDNENTNPSVRYSRNTEDSFVVQSFQIRKDTQVPKLNTVENVKPKSSNQPSSSFVMARNDGHPTFRLLSGPVDKVLQWMKFKNVLIEVMGVLECIRPGSYRAHKILTLKDSMNGPSVIVDFYEIDRPLTHIKTGSVVACIGKPVHKSRLQAFKVTELNEIEKAEMQRISFMCTRIAQGLTGK